MRNKARIGANAFAQLIGTPISGDGIHIQGRFLVECRDKDGNLKWKDEIQNLVTTVGMNHLLDTAFEGSGYTATGPFMGLISSVSYTGVNASDTMSSHGGWTEAGPTNAPNYSENRGTPSWSAASGGDKATSAAVTFTFSGAGTVKGCFLVTGSGAVNTKDSTAGTLYSAGTFTGGDKVVASSDVLNVSYTASLS